MFYQLVIIAVLLSTVIAPLFATFSLSGERVTGTMEFLRLAPLSTTNIVLGKMFAPTYLLHVFSAALLALGCLAALLSGLRVDDVFFTLAVVILTAATLHAFGAYLACTSTHFRGFAPVGGLVGLGWLVHLLPLAAGGEQGLKFLAYLSPWGALDGFFWQGINRRWTGSLRAEFCGSEMLVFPFVLAAHALLFVLFVRAASRKLEHPERPSLSPAAWLVLWGFVLATALGASLNRFRYSATECWACAAGILGVPSSFICFGILLDHPHRREVVLASECERVAAGAAPAPTRRRLAHALFITALTGLATVLVIVFLCLYRMPRQEEWAWIAPCAFLPALMAFLASLALEFAFVGFESNWARIAVGAAALGVLAFAAIAPVVDAVSSYDRFQRTIWMARGYYQLQTKEQSGPRSSLYDKAYLERQMASPGYQLYAREFRSLDDANRLDREYDSNILRFFWHFHPLAVLSYATLALGCIVALVLCRAWAYRSVRREAERAARGNGLPRDGPVRLQHVAQT